MQIRVLLLSAVLTTGAIAGGCSGMTRAGTGPTPEPSAVQPPGSQADSGNCVATKAEWAIGQQRSADLLERARVAANAAVARFLLPNQPITMEYSASRLNLEIDEGNLVRAARCG